MSFSIDWSLLVSGLGLFMLGMFFLELSLKSLLNRAVVKSLRGATASLWLAVPLGVILTALLQSSSLLGLLVLAFVGAGVMPMRNALGVILGANLGTTMTGWIVTWLGFKLELDAFALPLMGIGALLKVWLDGRLRWESLGHLLLGLGLLLFGLDAMKTGVEDLAKNTDLSFLVGWSIIWFLGLGLLLAAVIQSSSAVVMLVLSGLHAGLFDFTAAAAMVIGADLGTTSTLLLAGASGASVKRQVSMFHLIYNTLTALFAYFVMLPLAPYVFDRVDLNDNLLQLVVFHSSFNFIGIFLVLPIIRRLADWLEQNVGQHHGVTEIIHKVPVSIPEAAAVALHQETLLLLARTFQLLGQAYHSQMQFYASHGNPLTPLPPGMGVYLDHYESLKELEGEIAAYANQIDGLAPEQRNHLESLLASVRKAVYAAKSIKDVQDDMEPLWSDSADSATTLREALKRRMEHLLTMGQATLNGELSHGSLAQEDAIHRKEMQRLSDDAYRSDGVDGVGFSSLMNIIRETDECGRELLRVFTNLPPPDGLELAAQPPVLQSVGG
ncbi:Na/Pi symporter [Litorivivens sp.]|uniref:Na/Pi symporter n=1 Tax=Litorivivens sp. TaxID=2020868 RepID=UPI0035630688